MRRGALLNGWLYWQAPSGNHCIHKKLLPGEYCRPKLTDTEVDDMWFKQDGTRSYTANATMNILHQPFEFMVVSCEVTWICHQGRVNWACRTFIEGVIEVASPLQSYGQHNKCHRSNSDHCCWVIEFWIIISFNNQTCDIISFIRFSILLKWDAIRNTQSALIYIIPRSQVNYLNLFSTAYQ